MWVMKDTKSLVFWDCKGTLDPFDENQKVVLHHYNFRLSEMQSIAISDNITYVGMTKLFKQ